MQSHSIHIRHLSLRGNGAGCKFIVSLVLWRLGGLCLGRRTVDVAGVVANNLLDGTLGLEVGEGAAGEGAVDLQAIDEDGDGDEAVGLDLLVEALLKGLVKDDGVDGLVLHCSANLSQRLSRFTSCVLVWSLRSFGILACAFRCSFMCVCDAPGG